MGVRNLLTTGVAALLLLSSCAGGQGRLPEVIASTDTLSSFNAALVTADLTEFLQNDGPFIVFAPTNEAFANLPDGVSEHLLDPANVRLLARILTYHIAPGRLPIKDLTTGRLRSSEGFDLRIDASDGPTVNQVAIVLADLSASNGIIHQIDAFLFPPDIDVNELAPATK